ncbi:type II toxin-antitoxin system ParD family antitoxin [Novosphingobium sp. 18050]|uniref:type II toxin-antitoxin system ParD family antitoxin n=1 Tax=unclassified Novosphingobium TaxID=2644732 RepID=UPI0034CDEF51
MNISLPDPMRAWVQSRIDSGHYASASDYVRDLIRRDSVEAGDEARWVEALDRSIGLGLEDVKAGRVRDLDTVCAELEAEIAATIPDARPAQ